MTKKCPKCGQELKVVAFRLALDTCAGCGYSPPRARMMRICLQLLSIPILLWGLTVLRITFQIANQEFLHLYEPSVIHGFDSEDSALTTLLVQATTGILICLFAMGLFFVAVRDSARMARTSLTYLQRIVAGAAPMVVSFLCFSLVMFPIWMLFDASFQPAQTWARYDLFIPDETGRAISDMAQLTQLAELISDREFPSLSEKVHAMTALGPRIIAMIVMLCGTALSFVLGTMHVILNRPEKRFVVTYLAIALGFTTTIHQYENILWVAVRHRVAPELPQFQEALVPLLQQWPTTSGSHPEIGEYFAHESNPDDIFLRNIFSYSTHESLGTFILKLPDGGVRFSLEPHYLFSLEYHPSNRVPLSTLPSKYWTEQLVRVSEIQNGWYLTKYRSTRIQEIHD